MLEHPNSFSDSSDTDVVANLDKIIVPLSNTIKSFIFKLNKKIINNRKGLNRREKEKKFENLLKKGENSW